jgi:TFIIB zinc-binding
MLIIDVIFVYLNSKELNLGYAYIGLIGRKIQFVFASHDIGNRCRRKHSFTITDPADGEVICIDCGTVISDRPLESYSEWQTFRYNDLVSTGRGGGMPMSLAIHDQGLSTKIGSENRDFTGETIFEIDRDSLLLFTFFSRNLHRYHSLLDHLHHRFRVQMAYRVI